MNNKYVLPLVLIIGITTLSFMNPIALSVVSIITFFTLVLLLTASIVMNLRAQYPVRAAFFDKLLCDYLIQLLTFTGFTKTADQIENKKIAIGENISNEDIIQECFFV